MRLLSEQNADSKYGRWQCHSCKHDSGQPICMPDLRLDGLCHALQYITHCQWQTACLRQECMHLQMQECPRICSFPLDILDHSRKCILPRQPAPRLRPATPILLRHLSPSRAWPCPEGGSPAGQDALRNSCFWEGKDLSSFGSLTSVGLFDGRRAMRRAAEGQASDHG